MTARDFVRSFTVRIERIRRETAQRRWVYVLAALGFAVGFGVSLDAVDWSSSNIHWPALVALFFVGVPLMTLANAAEYLVAGRAVGRRVSLARAIRISVLATAANLLPLPGGPLVRAKGLMEEGATRRRAAAMTVAMAGAWLATAVLVAGAFGGAERATSVVLIAFGLAVSVFVAILLTQMVTSHRASVFGQIVGVELLATAATGLRLWLVGQAVGVDLGWGALILGIAPVLGAMVVVVPAGLGVREFIASLAAASLGLDPAVGFLIASIDRIAGMLFHGLAALGIALLSRPAAVPEEARQ